MLVYFSKLSLMCDADHAALLATGTPMSVAVHHYCEFKCNLRQQFLDCQMAVRCWLCTTDQYSNNLVPETRLSHSAAHWTNTCVLASFHNPMQLFCDQTYLLYFEETFNTFSIPFFFVIYSLVQV